MKTEYSTILTCQRAKHTRCFIVDQRRSRREVKSRGLEHGYALKFSPPVKIWKASFSQLFAFTITHAVSFILTNSKKKEYSRVLCQSLSLAVRCALNFVRMLPRSDGSLASAPRRFASLGREPRYPLFVPRRCSRIWPPPLPGPCSGSFHYRWPNVQPGPAQH